MNKAFPAILLSACLFALATYATDQASPQQAGANTTAETAPVERTTATQPPPEQPRSKEPTPQQEEPQAIAALLDSSASHGPVGLNDKILIQISTASLKPLEALDATKYVLFFDGKEVKGLPDPTYDKDHQALVYELKRNDKNKDLWTSLLGAPSLAHPS